MKSRTPEQWAAIVVIALAAVAFAVAVMYGLNRPLTKPAGVTAAVGALEEHQRGRSSEVGNGLGSPGARHWSVKGRLPEDAW